MIYLDNSAGTRPYPEVIETVTNALACHWGNASADNSFGHDSRLIIDNATQEVAKDINCDPSEIIWTSGACEANSLAILGVLNADYDTIFCTTKLEHTSIEEIRHNIPRGTEYELQNNMLGYIELDILENILKEICHKYKGKPFVSVSFANSEIGVIQDVKSISKIIHKYNGVLHVDATQMYPWYQINVQDMGIDLMSVSGQKMNCVKGVGFLYVRDGIKVKPIIYGTQQDGRRGGTMPTHLIAAFGKALEITRRSNGANSILSDFRDSLLECLLQIDGVRLNGPIDTRLPNNISVTIDGVKANTLVAMCDLMGLIIGKGSACKSYEPTPSKTLLAIGLTPEQALNTIRISLDSFTTMKEIHEAAEIITQLVERIRNND